MPSEVEALTNMLRLTSAAVTAAQKSRHREWIAYAEEQHRLVDVQLQKALLESSSAETLARLHQSRERSR